VQVKSGGYNAEYGRSTGSVISVITKSGGNEFHGGVFGYFDSDSLQSSLKAAPEVGAISGTFQTVDYTRSDYGADLGGYFVRDKLWFFAAYDRVDNSDNNKVLKSAGIPGAPAKGDILTTDETGDLWAAKLTWRITANHSLTASGFGDPYSSSGVIPGASLASTPLHYEGTVETGGDNYSVNYDGIFGQNLVVSARWAQHNEKYIMNGPGKEVTGYLDYSNPLGDGTVIWGWDDNVAGIGYYEDQNYSRDQYNIDASYFVGNLAGSHEFKVGYEYEEVGVNVNRAYTTGELIGRYVLGGEYYYLHRFFLNEKPDNPYTLTTADIANPLVIQTPSKNEAYYLQDTWQVANNLSLALGIRHGRQRLYNSDGGVSADIKDEWAPRIGFVWDAAGNGKSKVFGHWGYFYETIPMDMVIRSFGNEITAFTYNFSDQVGDVAQDLDAPQYPAIYGGGFSTVDPNLRGQYIEEYVVGAEYEFAFNWAAGIKYINRQLPRVIEDSLDEVGDYPIGNPGSGLLEYSYDIGYAFGLNDVAHPMSPPERTFKGVELTLQKRFSNNFQFLTSFLWSKLEGNYDGTFQASTGQLDPNLNSAYDFWDFSVHNEGKLSNDQPFQFKFDGSYRFNFGLNIGLSAYYRDGKPITAMGYSFPYQNWENYLSYRGAFGNVDSQYEADLHFGYPLKLGGDLELNFLVDIFQIFNRQGETMRNMRYTTSNTEIHVVDWFTGTALPPIEGGDYSQSDNRAFDTANNWQDPRTIRLGLRFSF
jgi:hypothetical protein